MNRDQRLAHHQQTEVDPLIPDIERLLKAAKDGTFAALLIRDEEFDVSDGYGNGSTGGGGSDISRPTELAALNNLDDRATVDYVHRNVEAAKRQLLHAANAARSALAYLQEANRMAEKHMGRQADRHIGSGDCQACDRPCSGARDDRLRGGYCVACYARWARSRRMDRAAFERATPVWDQPIAEEA